MDISEKGLFSQPKRRNETMIVNITRGDVFQSPHRYIVFAVNTEGYNDAGFAGAVSSRYWPKLANIGENKLGTVLRHNAGDKTFWALVCHSLGVNGWKQTDETVMRCLDKIEVADSETIAIVLMGAGMVGQMGGRMFSQFSVAWPDRRKESRSIHCNCSESARFNEVFGKSRAPLFIFSK
ncbi:MAG: hypothetical protein AAB394_04305 [Patescibacteria group bacterium]